MGGVQKVQIGLETNEYGDAVSLRPMVDALYLCVEKIGSRKS
jgi:hypothetical protein